MYECMFGSSVVLPRTPNMPLSLSFMSPSIQLQLESLQQQQEQQQQQANAAGSIISDESAENVTVSNTLSDVTTATSGSGEPVSQDLLATDNQQVVIDREIVYMYACTCVHVTCTLYMYLYIVYLKLGLACTCIIYYQGRYKY